MLKILEIMVFAALCLGWGVCAFGVLACISHFYYRIVVQYQSIRREDDWIMEFTQFLFMIGILVCSFFLAVWNWSFISWTISPWIKWPLVLLAPYLWCLFCDIVLMGLIINWKKLFKIIFTFNLKTL